MIKWVNSNFRFANAFSLSLSRISVSLLANLIVIFFNFNHRIYIVNSLHFGIWLILIPDNLRSRHLTIFIPIVIYGDLQSLSIQSRVALHVNWNSYIHVGMAYCLWIKFPSFIYFSIKLHLKYFLFFIFV